MPGTTTGRNWMRRGTVKHNSRRPDASSYEPGPSYDEDETHAPAETHVLQADDSLGILRAAAQRSWSDVPALLVDTMGTPYRVVALVPPAQLTVSRMESMEQPLMPAAAGQGHRTVLDAHEKQVSWYWSKTVRVGDEQAPLFVPNRELGAKMATGHVMAHEGRSGTMAIHMYSVRTANTILMAA